MLQIIQKKRIPILLLMLFISVMQLTADDYFWVGGSGEWSDINHWATSSGGSVLHNTPPSAYDDVFFDENSFTSIGQTAQVNTENAVCRILNWSAVIYKNGNFTLVR